MSRRQSAPITHRQPHSPQQQIKDLKFQLELKNQQIEDLKFQLNTLRKKQTIWHHLEQTYEKINSEEEKKMYLLENQRLKSQVCSMAREIQNKNNTIQEQLVKINDLKQYAGELKKLAEKSENIHKKQLQFLKSSIESSSEVAVLRKEKQKLENALKQCDSISKEMEEYYMNEIQGLKQEIQKQRGTNMRLERECQDMRNRGSYGERVKENELNELIMRQNLQKKWQIVLTQVRERYEKQISQLKDQIRFLIVKIQSLQDNSNNSNKTSYDGLTTSILTHSKMGMSSSSNESFRFTPNNSFSSSIKESLSRRETAPLRTPSKTNRQSNNIGYLLDRTNI